MNNRVLFNSLFILCLVLFSSPLKAQKGLDGIVVETYYICDVNDTTDLTSGSRLSLKSKTYRIWVDMAPEYKLQSVYGEAGNPMYIRSSAKFFNNFRGGFGKAENISRVKITENTVPLDSWITVGAVSQHYCGIMKESDSDGSIIGGKNNDGGSGRIEKGLLTNQNEEMGLALTEADGYIEMKAPDLILYNIELDPFVKRENGGEFYTENGAFAVAEGVSGLDKENRVLIAQITTDGDLSFAFNLQLLAPYGGVERFISRIPDDSEFSHPQLTFP